MTDKKYSLEEIEAAMRAKGFESSAKLVLAELTRPRHEFVEGQVVATIGQDPEYVPWVSEKWAVPLRPLTLTEHGPAVQDLRAAMDYLRSASGPESPKDDGNHAEIWAEECRRMTEDASIALDAFDSEISDD